MNRPQTSLKFQPMFNQKYDTVKKVTTQNTLDITRMRAEAIAQ